VACGARHKLQLPKNKKRAFNPKGPSGQFPNPQMAAVGEGGRIGEKMSFLPQNTQNELKIV